MIYGEINRQHLKLTSAHVVADTIDYLEAEFAFQTDDWDGLEKWAHFAKNGAVYDIRLTDDCIRKEDHLNLSAGIWKVYIHGNEYRNGEVVERITTCVVNLKVEPTGTLDGEPFPEMPASVTEQILARLENVEQNGGSGGTGINPEVTVERTEDGAVITIRDKNGVTSAQVYDGEPGVYVGSETPPPGTKVWVDPDGEESEDDAVRYVPQELTPEQQAQARRNIDAAAQEEVDKLSEAKVNLPTNEDGTPNHGTVGYYAVSDGAGGIKWVASGNTGGSTGGDGGEETIKTENLKDMAAFCDSAPISGYTATLNDDAETYNVSLGNTTYKDASLEAEGGYYAVYFGQVISGGVLHVEFDTALITKLETKILLSDRPITPTFYAAESLNIPKCLAPITYSATSGDIKIKTYDSDDTMNAQSLNLVGSADITIPAGYYPIIFFRKNSSTVVDTTINTNNLFTKYVYDNVSVTHEGIAVSSEAEISTVDEDYAMDYGVSATALITDTASTTKIAIDSAYAAVIEEAKNAWMLECNGNIDKIPLIVHTDQHSYYTSSELFDFIAEIVDWYDVGKVINLGDTAASWVDADTEHPTLSCTALENYLTATASVPFSKRIEVFGNHDTWGENADGTGRYTPQNYLYKYFRNIYARRADNYGNFVVYDDNYNVKYIAVSGMAYDSELGGYSHYVINPDSIRWIVAELEKADGYDVIILSHVPLGVSSAEITNPIDGTSETKGVGGVNAKLLTGLWSGRKDKTSGTVTDEYGTTYEFDFTPCDGELLCGLHGHVHADGYYYIGDLLDVYFDAYYISPKAIYFVIVDRENRRLNVWKVDDSPAYQNYQIPFDKPTT